MKPPVHPPAATTASLVAGRTVSIDLSASRGAPSYDIVIGDNILAEFGTLINVRLGRRQCLIVTDTNVGPLYQQRCEAALSAAGHVVLATLTVPAGEASKNFATLQKVLEHILQSGADRNTLIVALGGGMIGDLAGVAASLVLRGLDIVQMPTSLLAQVDSSVGGKTGINSIYGKNTIGAFHQPRLVVADAALLDSLPERQMRAGYAEIVKYGLIRDIAFFRWCQNNGGRIINGDHDALIYAVGVSCAFKAKIVAADEREKGERALLNFGHTFGHALETAHEYGDHLLHGEAVAIGIVMAFKLSAMLGLCSQSEAYEVRDHMASIGLPIMPPPVDYDIDQLLALMAKDKKAQGGQLTLILTRGIGESFVSHGVNSEDVRAVWAEFLHAR